MYLTIPDIVEGEELLGLTADADGKTFHAIIGLDGAAVRLARACSQGELLPLVVLVTDTQMLALDSVYVSEFLDSAGAASAEVTFAAQSVRVV